MKKELINKIAKTSETYLGESGINLSGWFVNTVPLILDEMVKEKMMSIEYSFRFDKKDDGDSKSQYDELLTSISHNFKESNQSTSSYEAKILEETSKAMQKYIEEHHTLHGFVEPQGYEDEIKKFSEYRRMHLELALLQFVTFFEYFTNDFEL